MHLHHHIIKQIMESYGDLDIKRDFNIFKPIQHSFTFVPQPCLDDGNIGFYVWSLYKNGLRYVKNDNDEAWVSIPYTVYYFYDTYGYYDGTKNVMTRGPY